MVSRKEIQYRCEYPVAPIRHKDVMDKLARCRFCDRLCCCLEHLVEHENRHVTTKGELTRSKEESKCSSALSGWVEATEHVLLSRRKINFPLFCIYCKITVKNEHELRHLMTVGPRCSLKESHWIISYKKYLEKSRDRKISLVFEETEKKPVDRALSFVSTNFSVNNHFTHPQPFTPRENLSRSLGKMKPISTSTPQDGCEPSGTSDKDLSSAATEQTPVGKNLNTPHSILAVKNDQKPKGEIVRKVTFSCIVETTNNSSIEENSSDYQVDNEKEVLDLKNNIKKKLGENDYMTEKDQSKHEKIEKNFFKNEDSDKQFPSKNADQNICDDKSEVENKTNEVPIGNEKQLKDTDESFECLDGMGSIDKSNKAVKEEREGKELNDAECKLENDGHGELEVPINSEMNNKDRIDDKTIEISMIEDEKEMLNNHEEIDSQNNSLDESGENSSQLNFYSEEESRNETNLCENESFGSIDYFKAFREANTGSKLHNTSDLTFQDSQDIHSSQFSTGQKFTKTSRLHEQVETNDNNESEPQFIENELHLDERASGEEDSEISFNENDDKATNSPCAEGHNSFEQLSNESNIEEEWGLTKLKTALSYSWGKAKELVMQSWGTKRDNIDKEEENNENCAKRMKLTHSCSHSDPRSNSSFPVKWKCSQKPVRSTEYLNISKRRPLSRMMKK